MNRSHYDPYWYRVMYCPISMVIYSHAQVCVWCGMWCVVCVCDKYYIGACRSYKLPRLQAYCWRDEVSYALKSRVWAFKQMAYIKLYQLPVFIYGEDSHFIIFVLDRSLITHKWFKEIHTRLTCCYFVMLHTWLSDAYHPVLIHWNWRQNVKAPVPVKQSWFLRAIKCIT